MTLGFVPTIESAVDFQLIATAISILVGICLKLNDEIPEMKGR